MNPIRRLPSHAVPLRAQPLVPFEPGAHQRYSLETVARLAQVSRHRVAVYCRHGLIIPVTDPADGGWAFDAATIRTIRQLEEFRHACGVNLKGARLMLQMATELEELRRELWRLHSL